MELPNMIGHPRQDSGTVVRLCFNVVEDCGLSARTWPVRVLVAGTARPVGAVRYPFPGYQPAPQNTLDLVTGRKEPEGSHLSLGLNQGVDACKA